MYVTGNSLINQLREEVNFKKAKHRDPVHQLVILREY